MNDLDDFVAIIRDELGLPVSRADIGRGFDEIEGWDSVLLLALLTALERETGRSVSLADVLEAPNLERIYTLAVTG